MSDLQRPPLDAVEYEAIEVAQYEVDQKYLEELQSLRVSAGTQFREEVRGMPPAPRRPIQLLNILREYASALFQAEAMRYPAGHELPSWLFNLGERIEDKVIQFLRPNLSGSLDYHTTSEEMKNAIHDSLKSQIEAFESTWLGSQSPRIAENRIQLSPTGRDQQVEPSRHAHRHEAVGAQIKRLCDESLITVEELAQAIDVSPRSVYRHLSNSTIPRKRQLAAYEKYFSQKLKRPVRLHVP
jgi:DNA-binding transcriptional ArsR family regulator